MDELLPPDVTADLNRHLDDCAACREYRQDLGLGRRLLAATEPELSANFDWRLQLRLNQTLQEAAGKTAFPWHENAAGRNGWVRNFTTAASLGLAAVLALAMLLGPEPSVQAPGSAPAANLAGASDRLPLTRGPVFGQYPGGSGIQQPVSTGAGLLGSGSSRFTLDRGWSGDRVEDLLTIQKLKIENRQLSHELQDYRNQIELLRARLDRADSIALDLQQDR